MATILETTFAQGPPDVSGLSGTERLEIMRQYRHWKEQPRSFDFALGPPDVSSLSKDESLRVLREYKQWKGEQEAPATGEPPAVEPPAPPEEPPAPAPAAPASFKEALAPATAGMAGVASSQRMTQFGYFERPVTARAEAVRGLATAPEAPDAAPAPTPRTYDPTGLAGLHSTQRPPSQHAWVEQTTSRPSTAARTDERVFAPLPTADVEGPYGNRQRMETQREARQRELDDMASLTRRLTVGGPPAGCATEANDTNAAELVAHQFVAEAPPPVAAGVGAPRQTKLEWHINPAAAAAPAAGMSTVSATTDRRAMVAAPDSRQAAAYNLQVKQMRAGGSADATPAVLAPWAGGGERIQAQLGSSGLSPRERLARFQGVQGYPNRGFPDRVPP